MHEFMPLDPFLGFLHQTCPINYFRSKTYVLVGFTPFCCRTRPVAKISIRVHLKHEFVPPKPFLVQSQRTCSIHNFRSKNRYRGAFNARDYASRIISCFIAMNMPNPLLQVQNSCFGGFAPFHRCTRPVAENSIEVHLIEHFRIVGLQTYYLKDFNALIQVQNSYFGYFHTISVL